MRKLITLSLATTSLLMAGTPVVPSISDVVHEITPPVGITPKAEPLIDVGGVQKYAPAMEGDKSGKTTLVTGFKLRGAKHISEAKLQPLIASYTNKSSRLDNSKKWLPSLPKRIAPKDISLPVRISPSKPCKGESLRLVSSRGTSGSLNPITPL